MPTVVSLIAALVLSGLGDSETIDLPTPPGDPPAARVGLVVRGGISLRSYEAGVNWALLKIFRSSKAERGGHALRSIDLAAATGASAGSINAFLTAITWCSANPGTVEDNLLWDVWIPIGWEQLFPGDRSCADCSANLPEDAIDCSTETRCDDEPPSPDGLFSRKAFQPIKNRIAETLESDILDLPVTRLLSRMEEYGVFVRTPGSVCDKRS